jgi:hypothetical protein
MKRYSLAEREKYLAEWKASGETASAYARSHELSQTTFSKWTRKMAASGFIELKAARFKPERKGGGDVVIESGKFSVKVPAGLLGETMGIIIRELGAAV